MRERLRLLLPALVVACLWVNQGVTRAHLESLRDTIFAAPSAHVVELVRYPFWFAYHRAIDEQMYFETAGVILGRDADRAWLRSSRGKVSPAFDVPLPPADGRLHAPYTEVPLEYPPLAVPCIVAPRLVAGSFETYARVFGALMGLLLVGAFAVALAIRRRAGAREAELRGAGWLAAGLVLAEGCLAVQRTDPFTGLFLVLALYAAVTRRPGMLGFFGGIAVASKFLPALVLPALVAADAAAWRSVRAWVRLAAGFVLAVVLGLGPLFVEPGAFTAVLGYHSSRGLQIESTLGILWGTACALGGHPAEATYSFGSLNFDAPGSMALARVSMVLSIGASLGLAFVLARADGWGAEDARPEPARIRRLALALLGACLLAWLTGKVFSPQYLTWGLPLVLAVPVADAGAAGVAESTGRSSAAPPTRAARAWRAVRRSDVVWSAIAILTLTQIYMKGYYPAIIAQEPVGLLTLVVRQAMLFGLLGLVLRRLLRPAATEAREASEAATRDQPRATPP